MPIWELKVAEGPEFAKDWRTFLACVRRLLHNNMVYFMLSEPIVAHLCGKAGRAFGINGQKGHLQHVWGDFTASVGSSREVKHCPVWVAQCSDERLRELYRLSQDRALGGKPASQPLHTSASQPMSIFWGCGRRHCLASMSLDRRALRIHVDKPPAAVNEQLEDGSAAISKGDHVYMILLASQHQTEFTYNCLSEGLKQHEGYSPALRSLLNPTGCACSLFLHEAVPEVEGLSAEQRQALVHISKAQEPLISIISPPGAGKSFLMGKVLDWWRRKRYENASTQPLPLAVVATGQRSHRRHLRDEITNSCAGACLILQSGEDGTVESSIDQSFLESEAAEAVKEATAKGRQQLEAIDKKLVAFSDRSQLNFIMLHAERVYVLHVAIMGKEAAARQKWSRSVAIVVGTSDKVRKCLQRRPWWARDRMLDMLFVDEVEDQTMPEIAALLAHFNHAFLSGDPRQALAKHRKPPPGMPCRDPEERLASDSEVAMPWISFPIMPWIERRGVCIELQNSYRFSPVVAKVLEMIMPGQKVVGNPDRKTSVRFVVFYTDTNWMSCKWFGKPGDSLGVSHHFNMPLFFRIASNAVRVPASKTVAVILSYAPSVRFMKLLLQSMKVIEFFFFSCF